MDKAFIEKNQIIERYLTGKLPFKGVQDFERYCRDNPEVLEDIRFADAVHKGVQLLEAAGGKTGVWQQPKSEWWRHPGLLIGLGVAVLALALVASLLYGRTQVFESRVATLEERLKVGSLRPPAAQRAVRIVPDRAASNRIHFSVPAGSRPELVELRVDVSFARLNTFRLTIDKRDQARAGTIHNLMRDSNGLLRLQLNTSSLSVGDYKVRVEGVTMRGQLVPVAWFNVRVAG